MKYLFLIILSTMSFGFSNPAFATKLNVNVQCDPLGTVYHGTLVFPARLNEWKLEDNEDKERCNVVPIYPDVILSVNGHEYKGTAEKFDYSKQAVNLYSVSCSAIAIKEFLKYKDYGPKIIVEDQYGFKEPLEPFYSEDVSKGYDHFYFAAGGFHKCLILTAE
jgi:hypothetical protein